MSKFLILALLCATALTLHMQTETIVGAYSAGDPNNPDKEIDTYIRTQFPDLANAKLTKVQTQVVAGINYKYTYEINGVSWTIVVWDQSWLKNRQVTGIEKVELQTNPNGQKVQVTTNTRIEARPFSDIAKSYFNPAPASTA